MNQKGCAISKVANTGLASKTIFESKLFSTLKLCFQTTLYLITLDDLTTITFSKNINSKNLRGARRLFCRQIWSNKFWVFWVLTIALVTNCWMTRVKITLIWSIPDYLHCSRTSPWIGAAIKNTIRFDNVFVPLNTPSWSIVLRCTVTIQVFISLFDVWKLSCITKLHCIPHTTIHG